MPLMDIWRYGVRFKVNISVYGRFSQTLRKKKKNKLETRKLFYVLSAPSKAHPAPISSVSSPCMPIGDWVAQHEAVSQSMSIPCASQDISGLLWLSLILVSRSPKQSARTASRNRHPNFILAVFLLRHPLVGFEAESFCLSFFLRHPFLWLVCRESTRKAVAPFGSESQQPYLRPRRSPG